MNQGGGRRRTAVYGPIIVGTMIASLGACTSEGTGRSASTPAASLNIGVAQLSPTSRIAGLRQLSPLLVLESLARAGEDGRMQPSLADKWRRDGDGRSVVIALKPNVRFQDGSPLDAAAAAALLPDSLRSLMGPLYADVVSIEATGPQTVTIQFRQK